VADEKDQGLEFEESDSIMPDPETLTVAVHEPQPLKGPEPDASAHTEPTNKPGQAPDDEDDDVDAPVKDKATPAKDPDADDDADWDPTRQAEDEAAARRGESKADLRRQLEEERTQRAELERQLKAAPRGAEAEGREVLPDLPKWTDLPEVDDYDGKPLPQNAAMNAAMKAMLARDAAREKEFEELRDTVSDVEGRADQEENRQAYRVLLRTSTKENPGDRDEVNKRVKAAWHKRGYTKDFYPPRDQMGDLVGRISLEVRAEQMKRELEKARKNGGRGPAGDTGNGGRRANPRNAPKEIEPDFEKAFRKQKRAGDFNDVIGR